MDQAEVRRHFLIPAHGIGHPRARVDAGKRGADQRQEHRAGLHQHEGLARRVAAKHPGADDDHHIAQRARRKRRHSESCNRCSGSSSRRNTRTGSRPRLESPATATPLAAMSFLGFFASSPIAVTDSNPTRIRIAMHAWMNMKLNPCGATTEPAVEWKLKVCGSFCVARLAGDRVRRLIAEREWRRNRLAIFAQDQLAPVVLLEHRVRIAFAQAQTGQGASNRVLVLVLVQIILGDLPVLCLNRPAGPCRRS